MQEFSEDKEIRLYAYDKKKEKSLSGKLIIKAMIRNIAMR